MPCFNSRTILNRTSHYYSGVDPLTFSVPCGKCEGCRNDQRSEWYLRSYGQFLETKAKDGFTLFFTLTYNNDCLPTFGKVLPKGTGIFSGFPELYNTPCFNKHDVLKFLWKLKKSLKKQYGYDGMRHIITSEYGEKKGRCHYHALLFFPNAHSKTNKSFNVYNIYKLVADKWSFGFIGPRRFEWQQCLVKNHFAQKYVSKYVCKDLSFFEHHKVLNEIINDPLYYEMVKPYLPKHWQSHHFGEYLAHIIISNNVVAQSIRDGFHIPFTLETVKLPRYVVTKLLSVPVVDNVPHQDPFSEEWYFSTRYKLTPLGVKVKTENIKYNVERKAQSLDHCLSYLGICNSIRHDSDLKEFEDISKGKVFNTKHDLLNYINYLRGSYTNTDLAYYFLYLNNTVISDVSENLLKTNCSLSDLGYSVALERIAKEAKEVQEIKTVTFDDFEKQYKNTFSFQLNFKNFDILLHIYKKLKFLQSKVKNEFDAINWKKERSLREFNYSINY